MKSQIVDMVKIKNTSIKDKCNYYKQENALGQRVKEGKTKHVKEGRAREPCYFEEPFMSMYLLDSSNDDAWYMDSRISMHLSCKHEMNVCWTKFDNLFNRLSSFIIAGNYLT